VVTVVSTTPAPEGATTDTEVGEVAVMVAGLLPKRTTVAPARPVPVSVAAKPPPVEPWFGLIGIFRSVSAPANTLDACRTPVRQGVRPGVRCGPALHPDGAARSPGGLRPSFAPYATGAATAAR